jgi:hypothetical protein
MADEDSSRFSLTRLREGIRNRRSDASGEELSEDAVVKSMGGSDSADVRKPFQFEQPDYDRTEAPKDEMRKYWRQFETTPIIRKPITSFASRVTEPGYFIETTQLEEEEVKQIGDWLDQAAILEGQPGRDFRLLAKKAIVQREVRGTALVEVAPDRTDDERIAGLKLINPETMEAVTRPNQAILMAPGDLEKYEDAPVAESDGAAAWLQDILETDQTHFGTPIDADSDTGDAKIGFRRDEIIPLTRDADVGEVFGTSRIEAVSDRVDGIKQKLSDNDEAIASKAYPLWLFMFGTPEEPWDSKDIHQFMKAHEMENFHPGMKQGVRGDVNVETISGEVADIAEYLQFDLRWIMSAMPMPMFVLGSFESASVGQVSGVAQQQDVNRQIKEARRELEEEFTPIVRKVAQQQGIDEERAQDITLKFGKPGETDLDIDRNEQVIRYISGSQGGQTQTQTGNQQNQQQQQGSVDPSNAPAEDGAQQDDIITRGETPETVNNPTPDQPIAGVSDDGNPYVDIKAGERSESEQSESRNRNDRWTGVWDTTRSGEELTGDSDSKAEIKEIADQVFRNARDRTLDKLEQRYAATPKYAVAEFENIANRELNQAVREAAVSRNARDALDAELSQVVADLGGSANKFTSDQNTRFYAQNVENAVRDAAEEMLRKARVQVRRAVANNESWSEARRRVEEDWNDAYLADRASLIAHMEIHNATESTKLSQFEQSDDIVGFRVRNDNPSTPLTEKLAGTEVRFDEVEDVKEGYPGVSNETQKGFDPLPRAPPYHFNDTSSLEPIYE